MKNTVRLKPIMFSIGRIAFLLIATLFLSNEAISQSKNQGAWHLTGYTLKDISGKKSFKLAGTNDEMYDDLSFKGKKGNMIITKDRFDKKTGKLLVGVVHQVIWSDPPTVLVPGTNPSIRLERGTLEKHGDKKWNAPDQSTSFNQGSGVYFITNNGTYWFKKDFKADLTLNKKVAAGSKGSTRKIQIQLGHKYVAVYNYVWRE